MDRLRIGALGAARITPAALIRPARQVAEVAVTGVAAREPARAREFAGKHVLCEKPFTSNEAEAAEVAEAARAAGSW